MTRYAVLLLALFAFPLSASAQSDGGSTSAFGIGMGYVPMVEGVAISFAMVPIHRMIGYQPVNDPSAPLSGGFHWRPFLAMDMVITSDEDSPYHRESYTNYCIDSRDGSYVGDVLCTPEIGFAGRADIGFSPGQSALLWVGPGVRYTSEAGLQPYAFFAIGDELFARANVGKDYQQFEFGFLMGI